MASTGHHLSDCRRFIFIYFVDVFVDDFFFLLFLSQFYIVHSVNKPLEIGFAFRKTSNKFCCFYSENVSFIFFFVSPSNWARSWKCNLTNSEKHSMQLNGQKSQKKCCCFCPNQNAMWLVVGLMDAMKSDEEKKRWKITCFSVANITFGCFQSIHQRTRNVDCRLWDWERARNTLLHLGTVVEH